MHGTHTGLYCTHVSLHIVVGLGLESSRFEYRWWFPTLKHVVQYNALSSKLKDKLKQKTKTNLNDIIMDELWNYELRVKRTFVNILAKFNSYIPVIPV